MANDNENRASIIKNETIININLSAVNVLAGLGVFWLSLQMISPSLLKWSIAKDINDSAPIGTDDLKYDCEGLNQKEFYFGIDKTGYEELLTITFPRPLGELTPAQTRLDAPGNTIILQEQLLSDARNFEPGKVDRIEDLYSRLVQQQNQARKLAPPTPKGPQL